MDELRRTPAEIHWEGDSKEVLSGFPKDVKLTFGYSLRLAAKWPAPGVRDTTDAFYWRGVWELKESDERSWYRVIYLSRIADVVCVLHGFEKQSRRTSARDIVVARNRLKQVLNRVRGEKK